MKFPLNENAMRQVTQSSKWTEWIQQNSFRGKMVVAPLVNEIQEIAVSESYEWNYIEHSAFVYTRSLIDCEYLYH